MSHLLVGVWLLLALPGAPNATPSAPSPDPHVAGETTVALNEIVQIPAVRPILAAPAVVTPVKPQKNIETVVVTSAKTRTWIALAGVEHGAAAFDAWSTRVSITSGNGKELNPLMRPFAGSAAIYGAIQVTPTITDLWARKLMHSRNGAYRKLWWLPQAVETAGFVLSGANNLRVAGGR